MPLQRRSPKWGFTNIFKKTYNVVNLDTISEFFENGQTVSTASLIERRILRKKNLPLKILGSGTLTKTVQIEADAASESAKKAIEQAKASLKIIAKAKKAPEAAAKEAK